MGRFVAFFGDLKSPRAALWLERLLRMLSGCRLKLVRNGRFAVCFGRPEVVEWGSLDGKYHLESTCGPCDAQSATERVWLAYDDDAETLTIGRALGARETIYFAHHDELELTVLSNALDPVLHLTGKQGRLSRVGLSFYLTLWGVPAPWTVFQGVWKLGPGRSAVLKLEKQPQLPPPGADLPPVGRCGIDAEILRQKLEEKVASCAGLPGPHGLMLSGGVDSASVAALLTRKREGKLIAYTIRYRSMPELDWDGWYAHEVAESLGIPVREILMDGRASGWALAGFLLRHCDEPVADPAMIPLYVLASTAAMEDVRHLWDGRGADELFGFMSDRWKLAAWCLLTPELGQVAVRLFRSLKKPVPGTSRQLLKWLSPHRSEAALWHECALESQQLEELLPSPAWDDLRAYFAKLEERSREPWSAGVAQRSEWETWFAEQNQRMVHAIEKLTGTRIHSPYADEEVVRYAFGASFWHRLPIFREKVVLKKLFDSELPKPVLGREKRGLASPAHAWLVRARPFLRRYTSELRGRFGDDPLCWQAVERWLDDPRIEPTYRWLLMSLVLWLHSHAIARVPKAPAKASNLVDTEQLTAAA